MLFFYKALEELGIDEKEFCDFLKIADYSIKDETRRFNVDIDSIKILINLEKAKENKESQLILISHDEIEKAMINWDEFCEIEQIIPFFTKSDAHGNYIISTKAFKQLLHQ